MNIASVHWDFIKNELEKHAGYDSTCPILTAKRLGSYSREARHVFVYWFKGLSFTESALHVHYFKADYANLDGLQYVGCMGVFEFNSETWDKGHPRNVATRINRERDMFAHDQIEWCKQQIKA